MNDSAEAIELGTASWEQWVGAAQRAESRRALVASRPRRGRSMAAPATAAARASLLWLLAASAAGLWLLH
jgi:hypothetical protein